MQNAIPILEKNLAAFTGAPYAVATDCCTHALELCLRLDDDGLMVGRTVQIVILGVAYFDQRFS